MSDAPDDAGPDRGSRGELGSTSYEIFIGALSLLSIVNIVLLLVVKDQYARNVVYVMDVALSLLFLIDFSWRLRRAQSRTAYFFRHFGWADLLASLPFPQVKILRLFRVLRVYRLLREYGWRNIVRSLLGDRASSALLSLLLVAILILEFGSILMLRLESASPDANITTASDSMWYMIVTMSTVGYGDQYPVTNPGRELGSVIILVGVAIFGTLTGFLANAFLRPRRSRTAQPPSDAQAALAELAELVQSQQRKLDELAALLADR